MQMNMFDRTMASFIVPSCMVIPDLRRIWEDVQVNLPFAQVKEVCLFDNVCKHLIRIEEKVCQQKTRYGRNSMRR